MITIQNEHITAGFNEVGAELRSLANRKTGTEHMWKADPEFWGRSAPILFPCVGESNNGQIRVDGTSYSISRHGFVRTMKFEVEDQEPEKVTFLLRSEEATLALYPFRFELRVTYRLQGPTLHQDMSVSNIDDKQIAFQLGGHPAFAVPFSGGNYSDYEIQFPERVTADRHLLTDAGTYSGHTRSVLQNDDAIALDKSLFHEDAIVFKDFPLRSATLVHPVSGAGLKVDFEGFHHLGIWAAKDADFVCIEPWIGCADDDDFSGDFFEKDSVVKLNSQEKFNCSFSFTLL